MKGLLMLLKTFGISDADIQKLQVFIPQVPKVAQDTIAALNAALREFDTRLKAIEAQQEEMKTQLTVILEEIHGLRNGILQRADSTVESANGNGSSGSGGGAIGAGAGAGRKRGNR